MDNASKALIIAGAVLIAVMLVSVGVMIYQQAAGVISQGQNNMDALEVSLANQIYEQYRGNNKNRNSCAQFVDVVAQQIAANAEHTVAITFTSCPEGCSAGSADNLRASAKKIRETSNYRYDISMTTDNNGYIYLATITGHAAS